MRATVVAEKAGVATVPIIETAFMPLAGMIAKSFGVTVPMAEYPGDYGDDAVELQLEKLHGIVCDRIVEALSTAPAALVVPDEPYPGDVTLTGTLDEINDHFTANLWTDGLPIVPPTRDRVEAFLRFTDLPPDHELGILLPERRRATVHSVAVNGVMAGCKPEYMPVLVAAAECVADPEFRLEDATSTPGWEPLLIVNGPIVEQLGFNSTTSSMRMTNRANSSIGRFLNLFLRNVAGLRPGVTSKGAIGQSYFVALAENEAACAELGWLPMSADTRGFEVGQNVVTVRGVVGTGGPIRARGYGSAQRAVDYLAEFLGTGSALMWSVRTGLLYERWSALFIVSPSVAHELQNEGWTKESLRQYLYENCTVPASMVERFDLFLRNAGSIDSWTLKNDVENGRLPARYYESDDPERPVPVFMNPDWIEIVLAGEPVTEECRGYYGNHEQGWPVSREVRRAPVR